MKTSDFDYILPAELVAQTPIEPRDSSRLMLLKRHDGSIEHGQFDKLVGYLIPGDVLVFNDSRVIPARLMGRKAASGGKVEILLLRRIGDGVWETLVKPGKRVGLGTKLEITRDSVTVTAEVTGLGLEGTKLVQFSDEARLSELGTIPLPPYIRLPLSCPERYQTVYAEEVGSVAAPTAGLHFTPELLKQLAGKGIQCLFVTLHVGLDTFRPVREDSPEEHPIHQEYGMLGSEVAARLAQAKAEGRRIIAVGTTTVRLLEQAGQAGDGRLFEITPYEGWVDLFILPGYRFRVVDGLITNFHLPRSTLLMLVSAFAGSELITRAYAEAIDRKYRFYSFGDAMLIL